LRRNDRAGATPVPYRSTEQRRSAAGCLSRRPAKLLPDNTTLTGMWYACLC